MDRTYHEASGEELIINVRLPRHFEIRVEERLQTADGRETADRRVTSTGMGKESETADWGGGVER